MEGNMKVAIMTDVMKMDFTERPIPQPKDDEVLVKIEHVGVCGSDLHYFEAGGIGRNIVHPPFVLGHEAGGTVVEVGKNVTHLKVGDKVKVIYPKENIGEIKRYSFFKIFKTSIALSLIAVFIIFVGTSLL